MEYDMLRDNPEFSQLSQISNVAEADLAEEIFFFTTLEASKLIIEVVNKPFCNVWHISSQSGNKSRPCW